MLTFAVDSNAVEVKDIDFDSAIANLRWRLNNAEYVFGLCPKVPGNTRYESLRTDVLSLRRVLCDTLACEIHQALKYSNNPRVLVLMREFDAELNKLKEEIR